MIYLWEYYFWDIVLNFFFFLTWGPFDNEINFKDVFTT